MGFGLLRVLNDDVVDPSQGFGAHPHKNMEIISIPLHGSLRHEDSEGNKTVIEAGEVQIMSAGTGVTHSEYNHSSERPVNFLQIWIIPKELDIAPRYGQKKFVSADRKNKLQFIVNPKGCNLGGLEINQDAYLSLANLDRESAVSYEFHHKDHGVYVFVLEGQVTISDETLMEKDAMGITGTSSVLITADRDVQMLLIEVPL